MKAIVYTSNTGHTAEYAEMLGVKTGLQVYSLAEAVKVLEKGTQIVYLGWLFANSVKGYKKAAKKFDVRAVCGVGLCDTGTAIAEVRKANALPESVAVFTMQGGVEKGKLRGVNKFVINMLTKNFSAKKNRTETDERMLELLTCDKNLVNEENTAAFMEWYSENAV